MDDSNDREYSRAPEFEDVVGLCRSLNEAGVAYVLIGGFAVILHGFVRGTKDVDLLLDPSVDNVKKLKKAMASLPDNAIALIEDDEVQRYTVVRVADEIVVDLMAKACGITYDEAKNQVEVMEIGGVAIPVANPDILIKMKDTVRPSDKMDVQYLRALLQNRK